jgi:hypothetical protein
MSKKREHRPTSKEAHESVKEHKSELYAKIILGLEKLKVGGTFEQIATASGLKDKQVWKRLSEMGYRIYNVGITRKLSSGRKGLVWQLKEFEIKEGDVPVIQKPLNGNKKIKPELNQQPLF